jgi:hypothetical protein
MRYDRTDSRWGCILAEGSETRLVGSRGIDNYCAGHLRIHLHSVKLRLRQGSDSMRLMGILLIVLIALWAVQGQRHHCYFGLNATYVHCLLGQEVVISRDNKNE